VRKILHRLLHRGYRPATLGFHGSPEWSVAHRNALSAFLSTYTGQTMLARLRAIATENAIRGAEDVLHTAHSAGRSCGWFEAIAYLHSLSTIKISESATDFAENNDREMPGEASLLERLSP
jgi:hypothetical protein